MEKKIVSYLLLREYSHEMLQNAVIDYMDKGWEPFGSPSMQYLGTEGIIFIQAVVYRENIVDNSKDMD